MSFQGQGQGINVQTGGVVALDVEGIGGDGGPREIRVVVLIEQGANSGISLVFAPISREASATPSPWRTADSTKTRLPSGRFAPRRQLPSTAIARRLGRTGSAQVAARCARRCSRSIPPSGIT